MFLNLSWVLDSSSVEGNRLEALSLSQGQSYPFRVSHPDNLRVNYMCTDPPNPIFAEIMAHRHVFYLLRESVILITLVFMIFYPSCSASEAMPSVVASADVKCDCWSP